MQLRALNLASMGLAATKGEPKTTRELAESGNKSSIIGHNEGIGFAEALDLLGEKRECKLSTATVVNFNQSPLSPILSPMH